MATIQEYGYKMNAEKPSSEGGAFPWTTMSCAS
jgi:hypothetical protein